MEIDSILGLPAHPLLVHGAVVLTPLAALALAVCALWPTARLRFGWLAAGLAVLTALLVPFVVGSGEALKERVTETTLIEQHEELGEQLIPWVAALAVLGLALMVVHRLRAAPAPARWATGPVVVVLSALVLVAATGSTIQVARIGHSGAKAVWSDTAATPAADAPDATDAPDGG